MPGTDTAQAPPSPLPVTPPFVPPVRSTEPANPLTMPVVTPTPPVNRQISILDTLSRLLADFLRLLWAISKHVVTTIRTGIRATRAGIREFWRFLLAYLEGRESLEFSRPIPRRVVATEVPVAVDCDEPAARLVSLDAFRGLTILGMLLVNNVALDDATPLNLRHANWTNEVHFADVIFPWFLFILGAAIPLAQISHQRRGGTFLQFARRLITRTLSLFMLGCFVDSAVNRQVTVGLGVLQILGCAYLLASLISLPLKPRVRLEVAFGMLILHAILLAFAPVPLDSLAAGRFSASGNVIAAWNTAFLSAYGLRGIVSIVPTSALVLLGSVVGELLVRRGFVDRRRAIVLVILGALLVVAGALWSLALPFNKPLWTGSYILYTAGWGAFVLAGLFLLADVFSGSRLVFPFVVPGMNAIFVYVASIFFKVSILETWHWRQKGGANPLVEDVLVAQFTSVFGRIGGGWMYTVAYILFWWLVLWGMYRKRIFLRV